MSVKDVKINKREVRVFSSFEESERADKKYWHAKTPAERLEALELMRQNAYGYKDATAGRLPRVLEVVKGKSS